ncbi:hypothetical protein [Collimonas sp.]|jgi:hypothetical protein|uniref:hypothetical protein n=1 Tax=Collimonas sp. TaxID=1963772 RepID=UPI002BE778BE|nr:hypothetical protein [Collimonas sp.]HWX03336.1 hypothetical protein [Collimonas sp.]
MLIASAASSRRKAARASKALTAGDALAGENFNIGRGNLSLQTRGFEIAKYYQYSMKIGMF